jgi:class 3 adenylate cyclase
MRPDHQSKTSRAGDMIASVGDDVVTSTFVFADLAGYTALTEAHGDERAAEVAAAFCDELRALLHAYGAEEIKAVGDALIVRVSDAGQALHLATRIVGDFGVRDRALGVRVGMHTGTAVRRGDDWFGSAVNVASRIADLAHADEVIVSAATRDAAASSALAGQLRSRGRRSLKHVPEPIEVFALVAAEGNGSRGLPVDPVCRITVDPAASDQTTVWRGVEYHFCSGACAEAFREAPTHYVRRSGSRALALVSDEARESAARRLARAYAKGRIDGGELEQRMEGAWSARTRADLDAVTHDLPRQRARAVPVWQLPIFPLVLLVRVGRARIKRLRRRRLGH